MIKQKKEEIGLKHSAPPPVADINVTPMVDVMLVLLIMFMVVTPMFTSGPAVDLAKTDHPLEMRDADREDSLLVAINRDGGIFFGNEKIDASGLGEKLQDRLGGRSDRRVFVKADARCHYGEVAEVVDLIRTAGVSDLGLLTEKRRQ
jgi:biopolymer transport protein ExbD